MNAQAFKKKGYCEVVPNSDLEIKNHLADVVISTYLKRDFYLRSMSLADTGNSARDIVSIISGASK